MDKNLVNIDDLVRQRLLGGEEQERAGAWLRMSELLEEEMPRVAPVGLPWRRIFGGLAVLLLIGGLSLGGYELNARRGSGTTDAVASTVVSPAAAPANNTPANTTAANTNTDNSTAAQTANDNKQGQPAAEHNNKLIAANNTNVKHNEARKQTSTNTAPVTTGSNAAATMTGNNSVAAKKDVAADQPTSDVAVAGANTTAGSPAEATQQTKHTQHKAIAANTTTRKHTTAQKGDDAAQPGTKTAGNDGGATGTDKAVATGTATRKHITAKKGSDATQPGKEVAGNNGEATSTDKAVASGTTTRKHTTAKKGSDATKTGKEVAGNDGSATTGNDVAVKTKSTATKTTTTAKKTVKTGDAVAATKTTKPAKRQQAGTTTVNKLALGSSTPIATTAKAPKTVKATGTTSATPTAKKTSTTALALNTKSPSVKSGAVTAKVADAKKPAAHKTTAPAAGKDATAKTGTGASDATSSAGSPVAKAGGDDQAAKEISAINTKKGKRIIPQLIVRERITAAIPHATNIHLDTISFGEFTELYDLPDMSAAATALGPNSPKKGGSGALASNNQSGSEAAPSDPSKPAKKTTDDGSDDSKTHDLNKKSKGAMAMESLAAAFNDIKYKAGHAQFAAGLTGGINGTFLGPNSFKGFQFGVTGKYIFSDALIIMGELKYYHRINDGYTLNDDYYNYSPTQGGYTRQLVSNPYGISTLHSVELPVTIRYNIAGFNFFVGCNVVYMFSINTGDYPTVSGTPPTVVSAMGNDNAPKIKPNDFGSKFGLGSIFGLSYEVSPKVTLDLRDVQTFWDNSKTVGAKYISTQLYRSPSFQLSLGYRFGGKKKDKE